MILLYAEKIFSKYKGLSDASVSPLTKKYIYAYASEEHASEVQFLYILMEL